jgi:uncharacterized protein YgfB (UPF0149 family)
MGYFDSENWRNFERKVKKLKGEAIDDLRALADVNLGEIHGLLSGLIGGFIETLDKDDNDFIRVGDVKEKIFAELERLKIKF